ncbi:Ribosomal protein S6 [Amanita muscaria]
MPLYQMLCIAVHYPEYQHIKQLVQQTATHVMSSGGAVRTLNSWGTLTLPQRMRRHKVYHQRGDYWTMHFDTSPHTLQSLNKLMRQDPRVIRWTVLNLGSKVENVASEGQKAVKGDSQTYADIIDQCT